jgi:hypothetical protein
MPAWRMGLVAPGGSRNLPFPTVTDPWARCWDAHTHPGKTRAQWIDRAVSLRDGAPRTFGRAEGRFHA